MGLLQYISYVAVVGAFAFVTLSLASGLLYVSELIEEHSKLAKVWGQRGIYAIIGLHVVLFFTDSLPPGHTIFSIICHLIYLQNFSATWPLISLSSVSFLASCVAVIADHFLWFFHFSQLTQNARRMHTYTAAVPHVPGFTEIASFFGICIWFAPLFLFLSLSANDHALPVSAIEPGSPSTSGPSRMQMAQNRASLFRSLFSFEGLPRIRGSKRTKSEGILAQHSPSAPPSPRLPPPSPTMYTGGPPRSPSLSQFQEGMQSGRLSPRPGSSGSFHLDPPPKRMGPVRRLGSDGSGLGLRRSGKDSIDN